MNFPPATRRGRAGSSSPLLAPKVLSPAAKFREVLLLLRQPGLWLEGLVVVTEIQLSASAGSPYSDMGSTGCPGVAQAHAAQARLRAAKPGSCLAAHAAAPLPAGSRHA